MAEIDDLVLDGMWWAMSNAVKLMWLCALFYWPWQLWMKIHEGMRRVVRAFREPVSR